MTQSLGLKANFLFNDLVIKSSFAALDKLVQESITVAESSSTTVNTINKIFYLKTDKPVTVKVNTGTLQTFTITDTCLLTGQYTSIQILNPSSTEGDTRTLFLIYS